jgi:outer membrane protein assembly factor BamD (BamD/ComL family)
MAGPGQQEYYQQGMRLYQDAVEQEKEIARLIDRALVRDAPRIYILLAGAFQKLKADNRIDEIIEEALKARDIFETLADNHPDDEYADDSLFMVGECSSLISKLLTDVYGATAGFRVRSAKEAEGKLTKFKLYEIGINGDGMRYGYNGDAYRELLERYPESRWADNAQFRLNEAFMSKSYEGYEGGMRSKPHMTFGPKPIIVEGEAEDSLKLWVSFVEKYPDSELMDEALLRIATAYHTLAGYDGILGGYSPTRYDIRGIIDRGDKRDRMNFIDKSYLDKALKIYQQIVAGYPTGESAVVAQYYIGVIYELGFKDGERAIKAYEGVLEFYPHALKFDEDALLVKLVVERIRKLKR